VGDPSDVVAVRVVLEPVSAMSDQVTSRAVYEYLPVPKITDYAAAAALLAQQLPNRVVDGRPSATGAEWSGMSQRLIDLGLGPIPLTVDPSDYWRFREIAGYERLSVQYPAASVIEKTFEHYLVFGLLAPRPGDVLVDIASQVSPLPQVAATLFGCRSYAQDIMYAPGVRGRNIGGDAAAMPVRDGFISKACLTCSFEHFEGDADTRLIRELARVIRPGGRVVIVPLYLFPHHAAVTDPTWSTAADVPFDRSAVVYCAEDFLVRHSRQYSPDELLARVIEPAREAFDVQIHQITNPTAVDQSIYARWVLTLDRKR
jgi:SAM-dependent methyltransferase